MANDFQRNMMTRGMQGNMGIVYPDMKTTGYSYNSEGISSSTMLMPDTTYDYLNEGSINSTSGLYGSIPMNSNNLYSTPPQSRIQQLEMKLLLAQSDAQHWKESYHMLLLRIGTSNPQPFAVPASHLTSPVISSIKTESPLLTGAHHYATNELKPVEFLQARKELLQVIFAPAFTPHQNHEEMDVEDHPQILYWHPSDYQTNPTDNGQLSDKIAYLEDENGFIVDKKRVAYIRADLRSTFNQILDNLPRVLQARWTQYDIEFQQTVFRYLRSKYVEFTFCEDNWKTKSFVSNWYSNWRRNMKKKELHQDAPKVRKALKTIPSKRRADDIPEPLTSRKRSESEASISLALPSTSRQCSESEASISALLTSPSTSMKDDT
ncbi:hypothetical protein JOM56_006962 [Amanita muscaria]